jgi:hypothetical protein
MVSPLSDEIAAGAMNFAAQVKPPEGAPPKADDERHADEGVARVQEDEEDTQLSREALTQRKNPWIRDALGSFFKSRHDESAEEESPAKKAAEPPLPVEKAAADAMPELPLCEACGGEHALDMPHISEMVEAAMGEGEGSKTTTVGEQATVGKQAATSEERQELNELKRVDQEVRRHEHAHQAAAGQLSTGGPNYAFETGADGKRYAVSGDVSITLKEGQTDEETIRLARQVRRAALAPASPSAQDRRVASRASKMISEAQQQSRAQQDEESPELEGAVEPLGRRKGASETVGRSRR